MDSQSSAGGDIATGIAAASLAINAVQVAMLSVQHRDIMAMHKDTQLQSCGGETTPAPPLNLTFDELVEFTVDCQKKHPLLYNHLDQFNELMTAQSGIKTIITSGFKLDHTIINALRDTEDDRKIASIKFEVNFPDLKFEQPKITDQGVDALQFPYHARQLGYTLKAPLRLNISIRATATLVTGEKIERVADDLNYCIGHIPIMVRSQLCNTHGNSRAELVRNGEDPNDEGGYFIIKGREIALNLSDSILFNHFHGSKGRHEDEVARGIFISKQGDAFESSTELILRRLVNGGITLEMASPTLKGIKIPFYLVYRMLGISSDLAIIETVVYDATQDSKLTQQLVSMLAAAIAAPVEDAFEPIRNSRTQPDILTVLAEMATRNNNRDKDNNRDNEIRADISYWLDKIDNQFFPHVGAKADTFIKRLRFFGYLIRNLLLIDIGIIQDADKDHYRGKRVHASGFIFAKMIKHDFNAKVIKPVRTRFINSFKNTPFMRVELLNVFRSAIEHGDLSSALEDSIMSGRKTVMIGRQEVTKSISSQDIQRKNQLNVQSSMRTIATTGQVVANQSERAVDMRSVHPSYIRNICVSQSSETGEKIGRQKQLAMCAFVAGSSSSEVLERRVLQDPDIINFDLVENRTIARENYHFVFVNNRQVGVTPINPYILQRRFQQHRRNAIIDQLVTIYVDPLQMNLQFWCDRGRIMAPYFVVQHGPNPLDRSAPQDLVMPRSAVVEYMAGRLKIGDMFAAGYLEYLAIPELENCIIAERYSKLAEHRINPLVRYTHCDLEIAILGLPALIAPFAGHAQTQRITMCTAHAKQACSWPVVNFAHRIDKHLYMQFSLQTPLIPTIANRFTYPTGCNMTVMVLSTGNNQEDSARYNKATNDHQSMSVLHYTFETTIIDKDEYIALPAALNVSERKSANYEKIDPKTGLPPIGTVLERGDIVIAKVLRLSRPKDAITHVDRSIEYKGNESVTVVSITISVNGDMFRFYKVKLCATRDLTEGDKLSSRFGNKSILGQISNRCDLWYTSRGLVPDLFINPHAVPTRMILGQLMEGVFAKYCALKGTTIDATVFRPHDFYAMSAELEKFGFNGAGLETVYSGTTGERLEAMIFTCPTYYQRLQKFVIDEMYSVVSGSTDAVTRQPLRGKNVNGGLRNGEMEKDVLAEHGISFAIREKLMDNSDGQDLFWCFGCGKQAIYNERLNYKKCKFCKDNAEIQRIPSCWMSNIFNHKLGGASIGIQAKLDPAVFH